MGEIMKKVILAVLVIAFALFLALPNLSWAQEEVYKAKCASCPAADGRGMAARLTMGPGVLVSDHAECHRGPKLVDLH
jgi:hypothetical protein